MVPESRTIRALLIAWLSLSVVAVSPSIMAAQSADRRIASHAEAPQKCCCGTGDGRCCGMACCGANAPKPDQPSPAPRPAERDHGPLTLAVEQSDPLMGGLQAGKRQSAPGRGLDTEAASSTLLAQHTLLQT